MLTPVGLVGLLECKVNLALENPLQTAVLNLFVSLKSRFPNLVVGSITRESVKRALANGITADQVCIFIIAYIYSYRSGFRLSVISRRMLTLKLAKACVKLWPQLSLLTLVIY